MTHLIMAVTGITSIAARTALFPPVSPQQAARTTRLSREALQPFQGLREARGLDVKDDQGLIAAKGIKTSLWSSQFYHCGLTSGFPTVDPRLPWDVEGVSTTPLWQLETAAALEAMLQTGALHSGQNRLFISRRTALLF